MSSARAPGPTRPRARRPAGKPEPAELARFESDDAGLATRIDRYRVHGVLGRGGMGVVYDVEDESAGGRYALKTIEVRFLDLPETQAAQRFAREVELLEALDHPGVVRTFDSGVARHPMGYDLAYCVMERLAGVTLAPDIKAGRVFATGRALELVERLGEALVYLEGRGIAHRDIKPGNVFLCEDGRVVLLDFGLARSAEFTRLTTSGQIVGTFSYMSPERLAGAPASVAADVFALGVVLFQLLTGDHPFGSGGPQQLMNAIAGGIRWPGGGLRGAGAAPITALITEMLAPRESGRPAPDALVERLRRLRRELEAPGPVSRPAAPPGLHEATIALPAPVPAGTGPRPAAPVAAPAPSPVGAPAPSRTPRAPPPAAPARSPAPAGPASRGPSWPAAAAAMLLVAGLAFGAGWLGRGALEARRARAALEPEPTPLAGPAAVPGPSRVPPPPPSPQALAEPPPVPTAVPTPASATVPTPVPAAPPVLRSATPPEPEAAPPETPPAPAAPSPPSFTDAEAAARFGHAELLAGAAESAAGALRQAVRLNPALADAHRDLGDAAAALGGTAEAARHYRMFLVLRPSAEAAERVRAWLRTHAP